MTATTTQSSPGILELACNLARGLVAESSAYAMMSKALNSYAQNIGMFAHDENDQGQKMANVIQVLTTMQWVTGVLTLALGGVGAAGLAASAVPIEGATALTSRVAALLPSVVNVVNQTVQGATALMLGGTQAYKAELQSNTERDVIEVSTYEKTSKADSTAIQELLKGVANTGAAIAKMVSNEISVAKQKTN